MQIILTEDEYNELKSQSCKDDYETNKQIYLLERRIDELKRENDRLARENCELLLNRIIYNSCTEATYAVGLKNPISISAVCRGKGKTAAGYHWKYIEEDK